jgi:hypothetical protein
MLAPCASPRGKPPAFHVAAAKSISAYQSTRLSQYDARVWECGMWCRQSIGFGGVAAAGLVAACARSVKSKTTRSFLPAHRQAKEKRSPTPEV